MIALDARKYYDFGIGTYIQHLVAELALLDRSHEFMLLISPDDAGTISIPNGWKSCVVPYGKYSLGEIFLLGRKVTKEGVSIYHSPHYTLPFGLKARSIVTIHDLIHLRFPQFFSPLQRAYSYGMIRHAINDSQFIITDTEFTKQDILRSFRLREEKIVPIHLGVSDRFQRRNDSDAIRSFRVKFGLDRPYILFVGNTKPHKGLHVLLKAFKNIAGIFPELDLTFVGGSLDHDKDLQSIVAQPEYTGKVRALGRLADEDLVLAYNAAEMLVLPSLYEGFGLPALEAMSCGTPVVVSDAASLPEVVGDAAIVCEKGKAEALAEAITSLMRDSNLKSEMIERGLKHARTYSWRITAQKTMELYDKMT